MKRFVYPVASAAMLLSGVIAVDANAQGVHRGANATRVVQLCSSGPVGVPALRDLWKGAQQGVSLAMFQWRPKLSKVGVRLGPQVALDDAKSDGSTYSPDVERQNALKCIGNSHAIGYVGTLNSGAALVSEPVLNRAHLVQVSPANTNPGLTSVSAYQGVGGRNSQEPATASHQLKWVSYFRTVTTDALQGPAGALYAKNFLHAKSVYVVDDKLTYGAGLASTFKSEAQSLGLTISGTGHIDSSSPAAEAQTSQSLASTIKSANPDMVYCGCDSETSAALPRDLRQAGYTKPYMGGDALVNTAYVKSAGAGAVSNYGTSVGPPPQLASSTFRRLYKQYFPSFFKSPGIQAYDATAYDAASIILTAVYQAAKAHKLTGSVKNMRTQVVHNVRFISYCGATGCMKFDNNGDTSNRILSVYKVNTSKANWAFVREVKPPASLKPAP
jgi:branched-chain amino acid transport system substrate-binding protein